MQLTVKNGKRIVRASKPELKALKGGLDALASYCECQTDDVDAMNARLAIEKVVKRLDGQESEVGK